MPIELDISTRVVGPAEDIYMVRPGEEFALYDDFQRRSAVFLDFPGLGLDRRMPFPADDVIRLMLMRSEAVRDWHLAGSRGLHPMRELENYRHRAHGRRLGKYIAGLKRLHYELPVGTIVVVPGPGYLSDVLIGEIVAGASKLRIPAYKDEEIEARRVQWVGRKQKASFSLEMIDLLQNRNSIVQIPRNLRGEVLRAAYDQFVLGETYTARFDVVTDDFSTLDDYDIQRFLNFVAGLLALRSEGPAAAKVDIDDAIRALRDKREWVPELASNVNSPGALRLFSARDTPLVIAVLLSLALSGTAVADPNDISIVNSKAPPGDACALSVQAQVRGAVSMMKGLAWQQACIHATDAHKGTGLKTSVKVRK